MAVNVPYERKVWIDGEMHYVSIALTTERIAPRRELLPPDVFFIQVCLREFLEVYNLVKEDKPITEELFGPRSFKSFWIKRDALLELDLQTKMDIISIIESVGVPNSIASTMADEVASFAESMMNEPTNAALQMLPFVFGIVLLKFDPAKLDEMLF